MSAANATKFKNIGRPFSNENTVIRGTYDADNDLLGIGDVITLFKNNTSEKVLLALEIRHTDTAFASGGAATIEIGVDGADEFLAATAISGGGLSVSNTTTNVRGAYISVPPDSTVDLTIGTAALTAGKLVVCFKALSKV